VCTPILVCGRQDDGSPSDAEISVNEDLLRSPFWKREVSYKRHVAEGRHVLRPAIATQQIGSDSVEKKKTRHVFRSRHGVEKMDGWSIKPRKERDLTRRIVKHHAEHRGNAYRFVIVACIKCGT